MNTINIIINIVIILLMLLFTRVLEGGIVSGPVCSLPEKQPVDVSLERVPRPEPELVSWVVYEQRDAPPSGATAHIRPRLLPEFLPWHNVVLHIIREDRAPYIDMPNELFLDLFREKDLEFRSSSFDGIVHFDHLVIFIFPGLIFPENIHFIQKTVILQQFLEICCLRIEKLRVLGCSPFIPVKAAIHPHESTI